MQKERPRARVSPSFFCLLSVFYSSSQFSRRSSSPNVSGSIFSLLQFNPVVPSQRHYQKSQLPFYKQVSL